MPVTLLYDRDCGFCRWSVAQLLRLDSHRSLRPVAIQSDEGQALLAGVAPELRLRTAHAIGADGGLVSGGDAFAMVARQLPGGTPFATVARLAPGPVRLGYRLIADNRSRVSKLVPASRKAAADRALAAREAELRP